MTTIHAGIIPHRWPTKRRLRIDKFQAYTERIKKEMVVVEKSTILSMKKKKKKKEKSRKKPKRDGRGEGERHATVEARDQGLTKSKFRVTTLGLRLETSRPRDNHSSPRVSALLLKKNEERFFGSTILNFFSNTEHRKVQLDALTVERNIRLNGTSDLTIIIRA